MKSMHYAAHRPRSLMALTGAVAAAALLFAFAPPASAYFGVPKPTPQSFAQCPVHALTSPNNGPVTICILGVSAQGTIDIGGIDTTFHGPGTVQGGCDCDGTAPPNWADALNGHSFTSAPQLLSKAALALVGYPSGVKPPSQSQVYVKARPVGPITFSLLNNGQINPTLTLPLSFHIENPLVGSHCYVGTPTDPVTLTLQAGTSGSLTGTLGTLSVFDNGNVVQTIGTETVDGQFSAPGATGCKRFDNAIDAANNLPSPSGANEAILYGNFDLATAPWVARRLHE